MAFDIPPADRARLRELAKRQAEIAALPVMRDRERMWYALNDGEPGARPPVMIESWTFDRDFMPESVFQCVSETGRGIENQLLRNIRQHELIGDDHVCPSTFDIGWWAHIDQFGVKIESRSVKDYQGVETGYEYIHPIKDLERDFGMLKPAKCSVDRAGTLAYQAILEELLGEFLPVRIRTGTFGPTMLTNNVIQLMGMDAYFTAMFEAPDAVHRLMAFLRDNALAIMRWAEAENLLRLNNGNQDSFGTSKNFTTKLPAPGHDPAHVRLRDMWGCANSQETVGVSPAMFHEFCFPYYRDVVEPMGLLYYGCCEPTHPYWEDLRTLPHLKKISINRWCDQGFMGEALKGTGVVFSRKPDPNLLAVPAKLDGDAWAAHIRETLEAAPGIPIEFIVRDVYTVHGDLGNARRAVEIARQEIDRRRRR
ncbi:MAG: hypothetical protein AAB152_01920 [Candidatus Coatesbacteria bacterium]